MPLKRTRKRKTTRTGTTRTTRTKTGTTTKTRITTTRTTSIATASERPLPSRPPGYPADLERTWQAADGTPVRIRPLRPDDLDRELEFVTGLSEQTRYLRLHYTATDFSRADAARLLDFDYRDTIAIGALVGEAPDEVLIGVSRYARTAGTDEAECAIVVADAWHGRGVGTELMRTLGIAARRNGIRSLVGASLAENQRIHAWARRFGFEVRTEPNSGGQVRVTLDLSSLSC